jgi:hypothetical protein
MKGDEVPMPDNGSPAKSELEKLFESAEKVEAPQEPKISTSYECSKCGARCAHQCQKCLGPFCSDHSSPVDPIYCCICLPGFPVKELPLTDAEGKVVDGKRYEVDRPRYLTTSKWICDQTDDELRKNVEKYGVDIHMNEQNLLRQRITRSAMQQELRERDHAAKLALRAVKVAGVSVSIPKHPGRPVGTTNKAKQANAMSMATAMMKAMEFLKARAKEKKEQEKEQTKTNETN